jgi:hypothetical protein
MCESGKGDFPMFISILRGYVSQVNWSILEQSFAQAIRKIPDGLEQSLLIQSEEDPHLWQIVSLWKSKEIYLSHHANKVTETCTQLFCEAGSIPERLTFDVREKYLRI